jgi:hypothetical protein
MTAIADVAPLGRYRRTIEGADFSLEANTDAVPGDGRFYLLRNGEVELSSEEFPRAMEAYTQLCREHWQTGLESEEAEERISSAWGILTLEPEHKVAVQVIQEDGSADDRKRMEQARKRRRFAKNRRGRRPGA